MWDPPVKVLIYYPPKLKYNIEIYLFNNTHLSISETNYQKFYNYSDKFPNNQIFNSKNIWIWFMVLQSNDVMRVHFVNNSYAMDVVELMDYLFFNI